MFKEKLPSVCKLSSPGESNITHGSFCHQLILSCDDFSSKENNRKYKLCFFKKHARVLANTLKVALLNIRSVHNKVTYVVETLSELDLDILCLTETWLLPTDLGVVQAALQRSYSVFHVPRLSGTGGGVAIVHSTALTIRQEEITLQFTACEIIRAKFTSHSETVHLIVVYRPGHPGTDRTFLEEFSSFLDSLLDVGGKIIICGDFNYWVDDPLSKPFSSEFLELLDINNFHNYISSPTHMLGHTLDLVLSPVGINCVVDVEVMPIDSLISDHALITFGLHIARPKAVKKFITFRSYRNIDQDGISREIESHLTGTDILDPSAGGLTMHYNRSLSAIEEQHFPLITKQILIKAESPWYNHTIASLRRQRRRAERQWRRLGTDSSRSEFVTARRAVVSRVEERKVEFYQNKWTSCGGDQRKVASLICTLMRGQEPATLPTSCSDDQLASEFMEFFQSKIIRIRDELDNEPNRNNYILAPTIRSPPLEMFYVFHPVDEQNIRECIRRLNKTYCQSDPIHISKIAGAYEAAVPFLCQLVNQYFADCIFVESEKLALLRSQLKKAGLDIEDKKNYRPISNLTFLSKVVERIMFDQLYTFMERAGILTKYQSAYRELHSTETALCKIHNDLVAATCSGRTSLLVLLDLSAAFDTIDHDLLLGDLHSFGIRGEAYLLMQSYLTGRFQRVVIGQSISEPKPLQFGVPQGSILGPLLFILYTSGLADLLDAHGVQYHFFADDTQIYIEISDVADTKEKIVSLLHDVKVWMLERKLKLNESKTDILLVKGGLRVDIETEFGALDLGNLQLYPSPSVKNLGITFDSSLNFKHHINSLVKTCNYHIRNLYAVRKYLNKDTLIGLVHSLILSHVDYCNSLFLGLPNYLLKKIQTILNKCARLIFSLPPRTPTTRYLIELHWLPVRARIEFKVCLLVYKAIMYKQPKYIVDMISRPETETQMSLRSNDDTYRLYEPRAVNERAFAERSFSYVAPRLYNKLPVGVKQQSTLTSFKKHLKSFLFSLAYDTTQEVINEAYRT